MGGKPLMLPTTKGQISDHHGTATALQTLPDAKALIANKGVGARLVPPSSVRSEHHALHSRTQEPQSPDNLRHQNLPTAQSG
ncbi:MAG: hypothetical protein ACJAVR_000934 [Paracoccaceae bacterium]|jgi:hypothetical protein